MPRQWRITVVLAVLALLLLYQFANELVHLELDTDIQQSLGFTSQLSQNLTYLRRGTEGHPTYPDPQPSSLSTPATGASTPARTGGVSAKQPSAKNSTTHSAPTRSTRTKRKRPSPRSPPAPANFTVSPAPPSPRPPSPLAPVPVPAPAVGPWRLPEPKKDMLLVHYTGGGFNNQLIQARNLLLLAKLTGRTACLPPFLKRKSDMDKKGKPHYGFGEVFSFRRMNEAVSTLPATACAERCGRELSYVLVFCCSFRHKGSPAVAIDEKLYNRNLHKQQSGFTKVQQGQLVAKKRVVVVNDNWPQWSAEEARAFLARYRGCVELMFPFPALQLLKTAHGEDVLNKLTMSEQVEAIVGEIIGELFSSGTFVAVHLRYENQPKGESKCRRYLEGMMEDKQRFRAGPQYDDPLQYMCFMVDHKQTFMSVDSVVQAMKWARQQLGDAPIYLASDIPHPALWAKLQREVGGVLSFRDSKVGKSLVDEYGSDILSIVEQDVCIRSTLFLGTSYSTWTGTVNDMRKRDGEDSQSHYLDLVALTGSADSVAVEPGPHQASPSPSPSPKPSPKPSTTAASARKSTAAAATRRTVPSTRRTVPSRGSRHSTHRTSHRRTHPSRDRPPLQKKGSRKKK